MPLGIKEAQHGAVGCHTAKNMTGPAANVAKMQSHFLKQVLALAALPRLIPAHRPRCCAEIH
jgi:hypothetical protein